MNYLHNIVTVYAPDGVTIWDTYRHYPRHIPSLFLKQEESRNQPSFSQSVKRRFE